MPGIVNMYSGEVGSKNNAGVNDMEDSLYSDRSGKVVLSHKHSSRAPAVIVTDNGVYITGPGNAGGIKVDQGGTTIQGVLTMSSSGVNIRKGSYSENPKSNRIFTYKETVLLESMPKDVASQVTGMSTGINTGAAMDGVVPIYTDISAGPLPHFHSISMKHVHRVDPAYLYRIPPIVQAIKEIIPNLTQFFAA
jgi:hypothetical protein